MSTGDIPLRDHALRVAVLKTIADETAKAYKQVRGEAESAFAPARAEGQSQQRAMLPDGTDLGLISIRDGGKDVAVSEAALEAWLEEHNREGFEEYADPAAYTDAEVLDVLRAVFPHLVKRRIRGEVRSLLLKEIEDSGGYLVDKETGDKQKVAEVRDLKATGAFSWRPSKDAHDLVIAAWQRGELQEIALGALALPPADRGEP